MSRTTTSRLGILAFNVIDHAYRSSRERPMDPTTIEKLALGYLLAADLASPAQVKTIWQMLRHEEAFEQQSCREGHYGPTIHEIKLRAERLGRD